jgi:hypothetical protein
VPGGREHRHVGADLGNDRLRGPLAHPGDGVQPVSSPGERGEHPVDVGIELGDRPLKLLQVRHGQADQQPMMGTKAAPQGLAQLRELGAQPPLGQLSQHLWSRSPATSASSIARPEAPSTSVATESSLMPASSSVFWMRWPSEAWAWMSRLR